MLPRASLLETLSRSLTAFQSSAEPFRVVATVPNTQICPLSPPSPPRRLLVLDSSFNPPTAAHMRMARSAILGESGDGGRKRTIDGSGSGGNRPTRMLLLLSVNNADKTPQPAEFGHRLCMMYIFAAELLAGLDAQPSQSSRTTEGSGKSAEDGLYIDLGLTTLPYFHSKSAAISSSLFYLPSSSLSSPSSQEAAQMEQIYLAGYDTIIRIFNPKYYTLPPSASTDSNNKSPMERALGSFFRQSRLRITMRTDSEWGGEEEQRIYFKGLHEGGLEAVGGKKEWVDRIELVEGRKKGEVVVSSTAVRDAVREGDEETLGGLVCEGVKRWILEEGLYRG